MALEYRLSCELRGHEDDVRGLCICGGAGIATSSRDRTVRFWSPDPDKKNRYVLSRTLVGHSSFVGPLVWIPPSDRFPEGGIVSGGMDTLVVLWDLRTGEAVETMKGHGLQVTGLALDDNGDIISSSVDWGTGIATSSRDRMVKFWSLDPDKNMYLLSRTLVGHSSFVGPLVWIPPSDRFPEGEIVFGGMDTLVVLLDLRTGEVVEMMKGHRLQFTSLALDDNGDIISSSVD